MEEMNWFSMKVGIFSVVLVFTCILVVALFASIWVKFTIGLLIAAFTFVSWTLISTGVSLVMMKWFKF